MKSRSRLGSLMAAGFLLSVLFSALPARADIYKWVDEKGVAHYSDQAPADKQGRLQVQAAPSAPPSKWQPPPEQKQAAPNARQAAPEIVPPKEKTPVKKPQVDLYITSWCKYCKLAMAYLNSRGVAFTAYNIEKDSQAAKRRAALDKRQGVPLAVINGQIILGFSEASYDRALKAGR